MSYFKRLKQEREEMRNRSEKFDSWCERVDTTMEQVGEQLAEAYTLSCHVVDIDDVREVRRRVYRMERLLSDFIRAEER